MSASKCCQEPSAQESVQLERDRGALDPDVQVATAKRGQLGLRGEFGWDRRLPQLDQRAETLVDACVLEVDRLEQRSDGHGRITARALVSQTLDIPSCLLEVGWNRRGGLIVTRAGRSRLGLAPHGASVRKTVTLSQRLDTRRRLRQVKIGFLGAGVPRHEVDDIRQVAAQVPPPRWRCRS